MKSKEVKIEVLLYEAFLGRWLLTTAAPNRGGMKRDGRVVYALFLKFGPIFLGWKQKTAKTRCRRGVMV